MNKQKFNNIGIFIQYLILCIVGTMYFEIQGFLWVAMLLPTEFCWMYFDSTSRGKISTQDEGAWEVLKGVFSIFIIIFTGIKILFVPLYKGVKSFTSLPPK